MRRRGLSRLMLVTGAFMLLGAGSAEAYVTTTGAGTGSTQLPTMVAPSALAVSQSGAVVSVSWNAASLSTGAAVQGYTVKRSDGTTVCGSPTLVTSLSCTDTSPPSGTYTYTVDAVYNSWDASATSASFTILTAPSLGSTPPSITNSASASITFSGGSGTSYQCQIDGGGYSACTSPASYAALGQGSHTFAVRAIGGTSSGPATSYTWTVDTVAPTQSLTLASGASGAFLNGSTLYYRRNSAGSFKLTDTVSDGGSGPASATFPGLAVTGWTHAAETVSTPSGGPYVSSTFSWSANPTAPGSYSVSGTDKAGNPGSTALTFTSDVTAPASGALAVNGTAASTTGSTSQATNSTSFTIGSRTDYTDGGSGLKSSVLTVQSETLSLGGACGTAGSGGPFTSATTVTGTTQPSGILAGFCYVYKLTGTDNVGNVASISTTVVDNSLSFQVTSQPTTLTAGTAGSVKLTAMKNGSADTSYAGAPLSWSGAANSPSGTAPTLPASATWTNGVATVSITLVDAKTAILTVTDGTRSATLSAITVNPGTGVDLAWTSVTSPAGVPSPCLFSCTYSSGFGSSQTWTASVSVTDSLGNVANNLGTGHTARVDLGGSKAGTLSPSSSTTLTIASSGPATSTTQITYKSPASGAYTDTLASASSGLNGATASFSK
jgi:hypothetical protein